MSAGSPPSAPQPVIVLRDLHKTYATDAGEVHAVRGVNLVINQGDFVAIMGSSGSGKSTMMNILGCLDQPTSGTFLLDGVDVGDLDSNQLSVLRNRKLGFVFQGFNLLARTTAMENVELPLVYSPRSLSRDERDDAAEAELTRVQLAERLDHFPNELSGGQQQRVAIARALVNQPAVLLADEPTGNLDSATSEEIMRLFRELNESGITIIMVTHESDIAAHARRTVVMRDGQIRSDDRREPEAAAPRRATADNRPTLIGWVRLLFNILSTSARALLRNKMRTVLTALGIIIGVASVIAMVAIGRGASAAVEKQIRAMGDNMLLVFSGQVFSGGMFRGYGGSGTLSLDDLEAIRREVTGVLAISPELRSTERYTAGGNNWYGSVLGVSQEYFQVRDWPLAAGTIFNEEDVQTMSSTAVIGLTVVNRMFPDETPESVIGKTLRVGGIPFQVIGVLSKKGATPWGQDQDDTVIIPFTTSMKRVIGTTKIRQLNVKMASAAVMPVAKEQINSLLRDMHNVSDPSKDDFSVGAQDEFIQMATESTRTMTLLLGGIAGISLLVGGIGIMNIMLVSVTERTREIGIRRAVGARARDIRMQFLIEAVVLSIVGGAIGIATGFGSAHALEHFQNIPVVISTNSILLSFGVSCAVGILFGYFPAHKAARLNPIEALRHE
jgi:macrolide transport system ATP-binding/permease protein